MHAKLINHARENAVRYEFAINEHTVTIKNDEIHCLTLGSTKVQACQYIQTGGCPLSGEHSCPSNDCLWLGGDRCHQTVGELASPRPPLADGRSRRYNCASAEIHASRIVHAS